MAVLKLDLDVIGSTCIRRKKPWPRLSIVGESVFLLDAQRISVLYMKSGKTKRKITKLQPLLKNVVQMSASDRGDFIGGLMNSGDLFLWHKMTDTLKRIHGLPLLVNSASFGLQMTRNHQFPYLCISSSLILVVTETCQIFVWELDPNTSFFNLQQPTLPGTWAQVVPEVGSVLPGPSNTELSVHAVFSINNGTLGLHCICLFVFIQNGDLCITAVTMQWSSEEPVLSCRKPTFSAKWKTLTIQLASIGPLVEPVLEPGAIVVRNSCDGQLLAIAVNQLNSQANRMAFVSIQTEVITVVDLKSMGTKLPVTRNARSYWIVDMEWSHDDLFLVCITGQGSVCLLPRLGEPAVIETRGFNIDMGPMYFLPVHPLISIEHGNENDSTKLPSNSNSMLQHFSVATHPSFPIFLFSDGFMVTAVELSQDITCLTIMRQLSSQSTSHLCYIHSQQKLHSTLFEALKSVKKWNSSTSDSKHTVGIRRGLFVHSAFPKPRIPYKFEDAPSDAVDDSVDFERMTGRNGFAGQSDFGKIRFGDEENAPASVDFKNLMNEDGLTPADYLLLIQKELVLAWGLAASHLGLWTMEHEETSGIIVHNLVKLCAVLLEMDRISQTSSDKKSSPELTQVLSFFKHISSLLCMDSLSKKLIVSYTRFVHSIIELLLRTKRLKRSRIHTLHGCYLVLQYAERHLVKVYSSVADNSGIINALDSLPGGISSQRSKFFPLENSSEGLEMSEVWHNRPCWKRLSGSWQLLFKYIVKHYDFVRQQFESQSKPRRSLCVQLEQTTDVMSAVISRIQKLNIDSPFTIGPRLLPAELFSIEGRCAEATASWVQTITSHYDGDGFGDVCRCLHSILYALLLDGNLRSAMELVELVVREPNTAKAVTLFARNDPAKSSALSQIPKSGERQSKVYLPHPLIHSRAIQHLMQSLGRVMAAYFTNFTLFVFPPHEAQRIPPLCSTKPIKRRVLMLSHDVITRKMTSQHLDSAWTVQKSLQYLLLGCHPCDAVWMVNHLGDWKTAFIMAFAVDYHCANATNDSARLKLTLPYNLKPEFILCSHLISIFQEFSAKEDLPIDAELLAQSLADTFLAATFAGVDLTCVTLTFLIQVLKDVVKQLPPIVPVGVYLPAPPVYCPQPVITQEEKSRLQKAELCELQLRRRASVIVNLIVLVLNSSLVVQMAAQWYATKVIKAIEIQAKLEGHPFELHSDSPLLKFLSSKLVLNHSNGKSSVGVVLTSFRDLSSLLWLMEVRDKVSLLLRKKKAETGSHILEASSTHDENRNAVCPEVLQWLVYFLPFSEFLNAEHEIHSAVLSVIIEMPTSVNTAKILAQNFPDAKNFDAEIQKKLQQITKEWQGIFLKDVGPSSGLTMNLVYCEEVAKIERLVERKRTTFHEYDDRVFTSHENGLEIGSRPFETLMEFAHFLGIFFDVCLGKALEATNHSKRSIPLLKEYSVDVRKRELSGMPKTVFSRLSDDTISIGSPLLSKPVPAKRKLNTVKTLADVTKTGVRQVGLFRSMSTGDVNRLSGKKLTRSSSVAFMGVVDENSSPLDLEFLVSNEISENSRANRRKERRPSSGNRNNNSSNLKENIREFHRATSSFDQEESSSSRESADALVRPLVPNWILEKMKFDSSFTELERLVEWLFLWAGRLSAFDDSSLLRSSASSHVQKPVMQVQVTSKLLIYSLWLIDNIETKSFVATKHEEITVAMVQEVEMTPGKDSRTVTLKSDIDQSKKSAYDEEDIFFKDHVPSPVPKSRSLPTGKSLSSNEKIVDLRRQSRDDEFEKVAAQNLEVKLDYSFKKRKLKKRNSKLSDDPREKIFDQDSEQTVISYNTEVNDFKRQLSMSDHEEVRQENLLMAESARTDSESSLAVSSLTGEDLHQTMRDTLIMLSGKKNPTTPVEKDDVSEIIERVDVVNVPQQQSAISPQQHHVQPDLATDLQRIIRDEMRRIMAAQHKGILTMLNSLEANETAGIPFTMNGPPPPPPMTNHSFMMNGHALGFNQPALPRQYAAYRLEADMPELPKESSSSRAHNLSNSRYKELKEDSPLKVSDLMKTEIQKDRQNPPIQDALLELHWLQNKPEVQPLLLAARSVHRSTASYFNPNQGQSLTAGTEGSPEFNAQMFPSFKPTPPSIPPLLRLSVPKEKFAFSLKFPEMFRMEHRRPNEAQNQEISNSFPVLQRNYFIHEPPDRDMGSNAASLPSVMLSAGPRPPLPLDSGVPPIIPSTGIHRPAATPFQGRIPFPLLRLPNVLHQGVRPMFVVPPHQVFNSEQQRQLMHLTGTINRKTEPSDEMQSVDVETYNRKRESEESPRKTAEAKRDASEAMEENLDILLDEEPVKLHSGYALTPGLFDEYLAKRSELGSVADTNASIQYEAVTALQPKPKVEIVLKKDVYTETSEGDSAEVDLVGERVKRSFQERSSRRSDPVLPPDVFMHLRFADQKTTENQGVDWKRDFFNVVDINDEMLSDILSSVQDKQTKSEVLVNKEPSVDKPQEVNAATKVTFREPAAVISSSRGPDAVTIDLLSSSKILLSPAKVKSQNKTSIYEMNQRIVEIAKMTQNMQQDFANTRLVVSKLEGVEERLQETRNVRNEKEDRLSNRKQSNYSPNELQRTNVLQLSADELLEKTLEASGTGVDIGRDEMQELFSALAERSPLLQLEEQNEEDDKRQNLQEWMKKKKAEQMRSFKDKLQEKRGSESHPFEPKKHQNAQNQRNLGAFEEERLAKKKRMQVENMEQRTQEMAGLLNEMLSDQPLLSEPYFAPSLTTANTTLSSHHPKPTLNSSRTRKISTHSSKKTKSAAADKYNEYLELLESCEREANSILKGGSAGDGTAINEDPKPLKRGNMNDVTARKDDRQLERRINIDDKENFNITDKTFRLKSFRKVVKLQRPEVTRQNRPHVVQRSSSSVAGAETSTAGEKLKIYGSTHAPDSARQKPTAHTIKAYAQRLQEMKQSPRDGRNEIRWRYTAGNKASVQPQLKGSQRRTKPRLSLTYAQQLQRLQPPKEQHYSNNGSLSSKSAPGLHWHKPLHASKTYTEQLKKLQQPATVRLENFQPAVASSLSAFYQTPGQSGRSLRRSRPYADPYSDLDASSEVSGWSVADNVRKILYGDSSPQMMASDTDLSELIALRDRESPLEYTDCVNIEDLEMLDSVSINSCIDWSAVDQIVAEID